MSSPPIALLLLFLAPGPALLGCARSGAPASNASCAARPSASQAPLETARLYDLTWRMRASDSEPWMALPIELHAFALGRWQCALSAVQANDQFDAARARVERGRRLACTHDSGATVQTELRCSLELPALAAAAAPGHAGRELAIELSSAPPLRVGCEPVEVDRLDLRGAASEAHGALCLEAGRLDSCPGSSP